MMASSDGSTKSARDCCAEKKSMVGVESRKAGEAHQNTSVGPAAGLAGVSRAHHARTEVALHHRSFLANAPCSAVPNMC